MPMQYDALDNWRYQTGYYNYVYGMGGNAANWSSESGEMHPMQAAVMGSYQNQYLPPQFVTVPQFVPAKKMVAAPQVVNNEAKAWGFGNAGGGPQLAFQSNIQNWVPAGNEIPAVAPGLKHFPGHVAVQANYNLSDVTPVAPSRINYSGMKIQQAPGGMANVQIQGGYEIIQNGPVHTSVKTTGAGPGGVDTVELAAEYPEGDPRHKYIPRKQLAPGGGGASNIGLHWDNQGDPFKPSVAVLAPSGGGADKVGFDGYEQHQNNEGVYTGRRTQGLPGLQHAVQLGGGYEQIVNEGYKPGKQIMQQPGGPSNVGFDGYTQTSNNPNVRTTVKVSGAANRGHFNTGGGLMGWDQPASDQQQQQQQTSRAHFAQNGPAPQFGPNGPAQQYGPNGVGQLYGPNGPVPQWGSQDQEQMMAYMQGQQDGPVQRRSSLPEDYGPTTSMPMNGGQFNGNNGNNNDQNNNGPPGPPRPYWAPQHRGAEYWNGEGPPPDSDSNDLSGHLNIPPPMEKPPSRRSTPNSGPGFGLGSINPQQPGQPAATGGVTQQPPGGPSNPMGPGDAPRNMTFREAPKTAQGPRGLTSQGARGVTSQGMRGATSHTMMGGSILAAAPTQGLLGGGGPGGLSMPSGLGMPSGLAGGSQVPQQGAAPAAITA